MLQRLQSLWLLLSAVLACLSYGFPFYSGNVTLKDGALKFVKLTASYNFFILILTGILVAGCFIIIFLYKERKLQFRLTILALVISILNLFIYFNQMGKFTNGNLSFTAIIDFGIPVLLFFAARGIWKDEKLVKSLDRIR
jgi:drug/metabolite transporter (DMT)-like permease